MEYDLDNEDEDWLATVNLGGSRLPPEKLERMLWRLELACSEATEGALTAAGAAQAQQVQPGGGGCLQQWLRWGLCSRRRDIRRHWGAHASAAE